MSLQRLFECARKFQSAGLKNEAIDAMEIRLKLFAWLAEKLNLQNGEGNSEVRYKILTDSVETVRCLVNWADEWLASVMSTMPDNGHIFFQPSTVSLPIQRLFIKARLIAGETASKLFEFRVDEIRQVRNAEERKTAVLRVRVSYFLNLLFFENFDKSRFQIRNLSIVVDCRF